MKGDTQGPHSCHAECCSTQSSCCSRSQLSSKCHGFEKAIITQANTAVGSKIVYDGERKRSIQVNPEIFSTFTKVQISTVLSDQSEVDEM